MAEGLFLDEVAKAGLSDQFEVDSAGTGGWHVGERADPRMLATAKRHGVHLPSQARKVRLSDFVEFDYILAMDDSNLQDLRRLENNLDEPTAQLFKMRHFDSKARDADVPDPYWGGDRGFEEVYEMLLRSSQELLAYINKQQDS